MHKVVIIDDEPLARQLIAAYLKPYEAFYVAAEAADGFEGFKLIQEHQPHLIFLDVQMPRVNGFELLELVDNKPSVIFTTAFDEYAVKAFEANALDYLLKPMTRERFDKAIQKWLSIAQEGSIDPNLTSLNNVVEGYQHRIVVKDNQRIRIIPAEDINYIEASDDYIKIFTTAGVFLKKSTLTYIEQVFDPKQFVRVHRSYFVPVNQISKIEPYEKDGQVAVLRCGAKVQVSKSGMAKLRATLGW
jgi:two-component system, LytTR family, response regulator